ncbi:hypothetical protein BJX76DRAFT_55392 [Aspergillus varians]
MLPPPKYSFRFAATRSFHKVTTDFSSYDAEGKLVTARVPIIVGDPGEAYVLIFPEIGRALSAANQSDTSSSTTSTIGDQCKLTFFHDSQHFASDSSSYPRLYIPNNLPRQTESNISPATLCLFGKMHEITLDGTPDAQFANHANATGRNLATVLDQLKDM